MSKEKKNRPGDHYTADKVMAPESITSLTLHEITETSFAGLDAFMNMRDFTLLNDSDKTMDDGTAANDTRWNLHIPESWTKLESLHISSRHICGVSMPARMNALKTLYIRTFDASMEIRLPDAAPELMEITLVGGRRERWVAQGWRKPDQLFIRNYPSLKTLEIIDYDRSLLYLSHLPVLERLHYNGDCDRYYESQELYLYDVPQIRSIVRHGCLHKIRLPGAEDDPDMSCPIDAKMPEESNSLIELDLVGNWIDFLTLPKRMPALERLDLSDGCLEKIELPEEMPAHLCLRKNRLTVFEITAEQSRLKSLDISDNSIIELALPSYLPVLETLNISKNPIWRMPLCDMPNLRELNAAYTDIESWRDVSITHPQALEKLVAPISDADEFFEIKRKYPDLRVFSPFVLSEINLSSWLQKWGCCDDYPGGMEVFAPGVIATEKKQAGIYTVPTSALPSMDFLSSRKYYLSRGDGLSLDRETGTFCLDDIQDIQTLTIQRKLYGDAVRYHFEAFAVERNLFRPQYEYETADPKAYVSLNGGILTLKLREPPISRTRGVLKIENIAFAARDGKWDATAEQISWTMPDDFDFSERKCDVEASGFYANGWLKAAPYTFVMWIGGREGDSRGNRLPARYFLQRFPDANVRRAVASLFPDADFSESSIEIIDTSVIKRIYIESPESLEGLEVFSSLEHYHQKGGLFAKYQAAIKDWVCMQSITVEEAILGHTIFDDRIRAAEIHFTKCRFISTSPEYDGGYIRISRPALTLKKFSVTFTKSNLNLKHKIEFPRTTGIREMNLNGGDFSEFTFSVLSLYHTEMLDLRGNNFPRLFELSGCPKLRDLWLSPSEERDSELEEIYLSSMPLANLSVEDFPKLKALRLPSPEDKMKFSYVVQSKKMYTPLLPGITVADCPELTNLVFPNEERYTGWITVCDCGLESVTLPEVLPENVDLRNNRLSALPHFGKQDQLQELDVSGNLLEELAIGEAPRLQFLNVSENRIGALTLPAEMPSLEILRIDHNPIDHMPDVHAPNLAILYAANTGIASWKDLKIDRPEKLRVLSARISSPIELKEIERAFPNLLAFHPYIHFTSMDLFELFDMWNNVDDRDIGLLASHGRLWKQKRIYAYDIPFRVRGERGKDYARIDCRDLPGIMELIYRGCALRTSKLNSRAKCTVDPITFMLTVENLNKTKTDDVSDYQYWANAQFEIVDKKSGNSILYCFICRSSK